MVLRYSETSASGGVERWELSGPTENIPDNVEKVSKLFNIFVFLVMLNWPLQIKLISNNPCNAELSATHFSFMTKM